MNFIDNVKMAFKGNVTATKNMRGFSELSDGVIEALTGYSYAAMQKIASTIASLDIYVVDEDNEVVTDGWMADLIRYPDKALKMTRMTFIEQLVFWLLYKGNAYVYTKPEAKGNTPLKLAILPSVLVEPKLPYGGGMGTISEYKVNGLGAIPKEHIVHIKTLKPGATYKDSLLIGQPRIVDAVGKAIQADQYMLDYINAYFQRQAFPPLILESPTNVDDETWDSIKARFNQAIPGNKLLVLLEGGLKANPLNLGAKEIDLIIKTSLSEEVIKRLCAGFGVPYSMLMSEYQNKDTSKNTIEEFHTATIEPMIKNIEEQLTIHLQELTGTKQRVTHDRYEYIDPAQKLEREKFYYEIGVLDADYFANMEGFKALSPKKKDIDTANQMLKIKGQMLNLKRDIYWREKDATNTRFTEKMAVKLKAVVKEIEVQTLASIAKAKSLKGLRTPTELFDMDSILSMTTELLGDDWNEFITNRIRSSEGDINVTPDPLSNYEQYIKDITRISTDSIKESYQNMGKELKDTIQNVVEANPYATDEELISSITESVKGKVGQLSVGRINTIARTTATSMNGSAQERVYTKFNSPYLWLSQRDNDVRDAHKDADGKSPDANGNFSVGGDLMRYPGGGSTAAQNANCRCILGAGMSVIGDDEV